MKNIYNEELNEKKYYRFSIMLDSPYKWGDGYGGASQEEIELNEMAISTACEHLGLKRKKGDGFGECDVYYDNELSEIYCHPMQLSGTLHSEDIEVLIRFLGPTSIFHETTRIADIRIGEEVIKHTQEDIINYCNEIDNTYKDIAKERPWGIPCNYLLHYYPQFKFKEYNFSPCECSLKEKKWERFLVDYLNNKIKELKK